MPKTATHSGECQGCGRQQKLPDGKLSLHGYEVQWNQFSGTCDGAKEPPYELSCEYCKATIVRSRAQMERHLEAAKALRIPTKDPILSDLNVPTEWNFKRRAYDTRVAFNVRLEVVPDSTSTKITGIYTMGGEVKTVDITGSHGIRPRWEGTPLQIVNRFRREAAETQEMFAGHLDRYIKWQEKRVADWKLRPLTPVPDETVVVAKRGEVSLLRNLQVGDVRQIRNLSGQYQRTSPVYNSALKLVTLGYVTCIERDDSPRGFVKIQINDAGRAFLASF